MSINYNNKVKINRPSWDEYFINIAEVISTRSHDAETKVGAVIIDINKRILSTGYNGFPSGYDDSKLPNLRPDKYPFMVHAEMNAIIYAKQSLQDCTIYTTHSPCKDCVKAIISSGIKSIIFKHPYINDDFELIKNITKIYGLEFKLYDQELSPI